VAEVSTAAPFLATGAGRFRAKNSGISMIPMKIGLIM
jgi:hypothetical protein